MVVGCCGDFVCSLVLCYLLLLLLLVVVGRCADLLLVVVCWWLFSALGCVVEEFSTPCVAAFDCCAVFFEVSIGSI